MSQFTPSVFPPLSSSPPLAVATCEMFLIHFGNHGRTSARSYHPELCGARVHFLLMSEFMSRRQHELRDPCESLHPSPVIRMVSFHYEPPVTLRATRCLRLSVMVVGAFVFFAISWTCFQLPLPYLSQLLLLFLSSSSSCLPHLLNLSRPPHAPLPQVVQDLLPLIFQLRRWFLRCPNCSSRCFRHEMTRRSSDRRHTVSRSAGGAVVGFRAGPHPNSVAWRGEHVAG